MGGMNMDGQDEKEGMNKKSLIGVDRLIDGGNG